MADLKRTLDQVFKHIDAKKAGDSGKKWVGFCPCHDDHKPSLGITQTRNKILIICRAGCDNRDIVRACGVEMKDLFANDLPSGSTRTRRKDSAIANADVANDKPSEPNEPPPDWPAIHQTYLSHPGTPRARQHLAKRLGVSVSSLERLEVGRDCGGGRFWTVPERDGEGAIVGIGRRLENGSKLAIGKSNRGLYIPMDVATAPSGPALFVEGMTGTAAGLTMGLQVGGRPNNYLGQTPAQIAALVRRTLLPGTPILIVGDRDPKRDGRWPGREGAERTARELAELLGAEWRVAWTVCPPGSKDTRAWLNARCKERWILPDDGEACAALGQEYLGLLMAGAVEVRPAEQTLPPGGAVKAVIAAAMMTLPEPLEPEPTEDCQAAGEGEDEHAECHSPECDHQHDHAEDVRPQLETRGEENAPPPCEQQEGGHHTCEEHGNHHPGTPPNDPPKPPTDAELRRMAGLWKPRYQPCPCYKKSKDFQAKDQEKNYNFVGKLRCRRITCWFACRPLKIDQRFLYHGKQLLACKCVTRFEIPARLSQEKDWNALRTAAKRDSLEWVKLKMRPDKGGDIVVYVGGCLDREGGEKLAGAAAVRRFGKDLTGGRLGGLEHSDDCKACRSITSSKGWSLCLEEKESKYWLGIDVDACNPDIVVESLHAAGAHQLPTKEGCETFDWRVPYRNGSLTYLALQDVLAEIHEPTPPEPQTWEEAGREIDESHEPEHSW